MRPFIPAKDLSYFEHFIECNDLGRTQTDSTPTRHALGWVRQSVRNIYYIRCCILTFTVSFIVVIKNEHWLSDTMIVGRVDFCIYAYTVWVRKSPPPPRLSDIFSFFSRPYKRSRYWYSVASVVVVCRLTVTWCIVAKWCVIEQKLLLTAYRKSYMRNRLVSKWMTLTFV